MLLKWVFNVCAPKTGLQIIKTKKGFQNDLKILNQI